MKITQDLVPFTCSGDDRVSTTYLILHATAGGSYLGAKAAYVARGVSAHYTIEPNGNIFQNVLESRVAWHAGESRWGDLHFLNQHSIGIEMVGMNEPTSSYPETQVQSCIELAKDICQRHAIPWQHILTHAMISPGRKSDPANFSAYPRVLEAVMGKVGASRVFLNGQEITGQRRDVVGGVVVNATNPDKIFVQTD